MLARINLRRALTIAGIAVLVISYVLLWLQMIASPTERTAADFIAFYSAGRIADTQGLARVLMARTGRTTLTLRNFCTFVARSRFIRR